MADGAGAGDGTCHVSAPPARSCAMRACDAARVADVLLATMARRLFSACALASERTVSAWRWRGLR